MTSTNTLDLSGGPCVIRIRKGSDQTLVFQCFDAECEPADLTDQAPTVRVIDGVTEHVLTSMIEGSAIHAELPHALSSTLPLMTKIAVSVTQVSTGFVTPLVFGQLVTLQSPTA